MPSRIQRRREKGWRLPKGAVVVTRPGKWGNPFVVREWDHAWHVLDARTKCTAWEWPLRTRAEAAARAVMLYEGALRAGGLRVTVDDVRRELRGKDLACFCRLGDPCHAEALLRIANEEN